MERLLRDEERRRESRAQMLQKKALEESAGDANDTFRPTLITNKKSQPQARNFKLLYNDLIQHQQNH